MSVESVKKNIGFIFERRKAAIYALSLRYAALAINYFRAEQSGGRFWNNETKTAKDTMFTNAFIEDDVIGWFMAHDVEYGPYLELANNRQNEAIAPVIKRFAGRFFRDVKELLSD